MHNTHTHKPVIWLAADKAKQRIMAQRVADELLALGGRFAGALVEDIGSAQAGAPDIVLGAGQETAGLLVALKAQHPSCYTVMILDPGGDYGRFNLVALSGHEPLPSPLPDNAVPLCGLINRITPVLLEATRSEVARGDWPEIAWNALPQPYYAVLLGGRFAGGSLNEQDMAYLAGLLNQMIEAQGGSLLVATSPRTEAAPLAAFTEALRAPNHIYDYRTGRGAKNPYLACLAMAGAIIVTGDSARMCSESCSSGKPVYIYQPSVAFNPYARLHDMLYARGLARPFTGEALLTDRPAPHLNEAKRLAEIIAKALLP